MGGGDEVIVRPDEVERWMNEDRIWRIRLCRILVMMHNSSARSLKSLVRETPIKY